MGRKTIKVNIGSLTLGGGTPVRIQSMVKVDTTRIKSVIKSIHELKTAGCEIIRIAVPHARAARSLAKIKKTSPLPIVADIHFTNRLAMAALEAGADKIRINPGNMKFDDELKYFLDAAKKRKVPLRLGVNSGSVSERLGKKNCLDPMLKKLLKFTKKVEDHGFKQLVLSYKSHSVTETIAAYRLLAKQTCYPLHLGLTASGTGQSGLIKSVLALGILLEEGIGDTIRISLSGPAITEVRAAWEMLHALNIRKKTTPEIMACPTCGRAHLNTALVAEKLEKAVGDKHLPLKVAVMGCEVNGPGEAQEADLGVAGFRGGATLFVKGKKIKRLPSERILEVLIKKMKSLAVRRKNEIL